MLAQAHLPLGRVDSAVTGISFSFAHFHLGKHYTELDRFDRAEEHYLTFLETFTQPDPEYVWLMTEAQQALETLARGR